MDDDGIDWTADRWFAKYHAQYLTDSFKAFWVGFYGPPDDYTKEHGEQEEYWGRCAFCLIGWRGARSVEDGRAQFALSGCGHRDTLSVYESDGGVLFRCRACGMGKGTNGVWDIPKRGAGA